MVSCWFCELQENAIIPLRKIENIVFDKCMVFSLFCKGKNHTKGIVFGFWFYLVRAGGQVYAWAEIISLRRA